MTDCIFCKIARGEAPADIVYEDEEVVAFRDLNPQAPQHLLIIPRKHIATANDIAPEDAPVTGRLFVAAGIIAGRLGVAEEGYRLVMNCNRRAGQTVFHIHLHLLAGRDMQWPPWPR